MFFYVITKNLNWEILTKNLRKKNFNIMGVHKNLATSAVSNANLF